MLVLDMQVDNVKLHERIFKKTDQKTGGLQHCAAIDD